MTDARVHSDHYKVREYCGDFDIGIPYSADRFGAEVTVLTDRRQANELRHFMEWRFLHPDERLDDVLPLSS